MEDLTNLNERRSVVSDGHGGTRNGAVRHSAEKHARGRDETGQDHDAEHGQASGTRAERALVVHCEADVLAAIADALREEGFDVRATTEGEMALRWLHETERELVILDLEVPGLRALETCRAIRAASAVPIMIVTARDSPADRVLGLEAGADDYVGTPFSQAELISRVRAIMRRRRLDLLPSEAISQIGDLRIDFVGHRVLVAGEAVHLTPTEFRLLAILARQPGRPLSPEQILRALWETDHVGPDGACRTHISNLRRKIDADRAKSPHIVTVPRVGYLLDDEHADDVHIS